MDLAYIADLQGNSFGVYQKGDPLKIFVKKLVAKYEYHHQIMQYHIPQ